MDARRATIVVFAGAGLVFLGGFLNSYRMAGAVSAQGEIQERRLEEGRIERDIEKEREKDETDEKKIEELQKRLEKVEKENKEELDDLRMEAKEKQVAWQAGFSTPIWIKFLGALTMAVGITFVLLKGSEVERAAAVFVAAVILPRLVDLDLFAFTAVMEAM